MASYLPITNNQVGGYDGWPIGTVRYRSYNEAQVSHAQALAAAQQILAQDGLGALLNATSSSQPSPPSGHTWVQVGGVGNSVSSTLGLTTTPVLQHIFQNNLLESWDTSKVNVVLDYYDPVTQTAYCTQAANPAGENGKVWMNDIGLDVLLTDQQFHDLGFDICQPFDITRWLVNPNLPSKELQLLETNRGNYYGYRQRFWYI